VTREEGLSLALLHPPALRGFVLIRHRPTFGFGRASRRATCWLLGMLIGAVAFSPRASAIIFYATADLNHNTTAPTGALANSGWQWVGTWGGFQATAVGPSHILAAKHVGGAVGEGFTLNGVTYTATAFFDHPTSDLRLWKIQGTLPSWAPLYRLPDENGKAIVVFGRGVTRGPEVRVNGVLKGWQFGPGDGRLRWGRNVIMDVLPNVAGWGSVLAAKFDAPGVENEAFFTVGDSSGPAFIQDGATWRLAGLGAYVDGFYATSDAGPAFTAAIFDLNGLYVGRSEGPWTAISFFNNVRGAFYLTRISSNLAWIDATLAADSGSPIAPAITQSPADQTATAGATVTFSITATGTPAPTYQWRKNTVAIPGAINASLILSTVQAGDAGAYSVVVSNSAGSVTSTAALLTVNPAPVPPAITAQPATQTVIAGAPVTFSVNATGVPAPTYQWRKNSSPIPGATSASLVLSTVQAGDAGSYSVVVTNSAGSVTSATASLTVNPPPVPPAITTQPSPQTVIAGTGARFAVAAASPSPLTYQWFKDGSPVLGATNASLVLPAANAAQAGLYTVRLTNDGGVVTSTSALLTVLPPSRLINLSVRAQLDSDSAPLILGFVNRGPVAKAVLIRAIGPTLALFGVSSTVADPRLELFQGTTTVAGNEDWGGTTPLLEAFARVGAFALPSNSKDAAMTASVSAVGYTARALSAGGAPGSLLVEVYDADPATEASSRLINLSARHEVRSVDQPLIAGFIIRGESPKTLLVRGVGPGLGGFGVLQPLADPRLKIIAADGRVVAENENWDEATSGTAAFAQAGAFPLVTGSRDAALTITLPAGAYTAHVIGSAGTSGTALLEVYDLL